MLVIKTLEFIVKMFEELIYLLAYYAILVVRKAWEYRCLLAFYGFMAFVVVGGLVTYVLKTN